jgi:hypothetical protein
MHLTPKGFVLQDKWITHLFYENYGVRQTDLKYSNTNPPQADSVFKSVCVAPLGVIYNF